jgi:hypothetical protein
MFSEMRESSASLFRLFIFIKRFSDGKLYIAEEMENLDLEAAQSNG